MRYHYTHIRLSKIWNTSNTKCWQGDQVTGTFIHCGGDAKWYSYCWREFGSVYKTEHTLTYNLANAFLGIYANELESYVRTHTHTQMHMNVYNSFIPSCQNLETIKISSVDEQINKLWYTQTLEYYSALKKWATKIWRNAYYIYYIKYILLSERCQSEKSICCMIPTRSSGKAKLCRLKDQWLPGIAESKKWIHGAQIILR